MFFLKKLLERAASLFVRFELASNPCDNPATVDSLPLAEQFAVVFKM